VKVVYDRESDTLTITLRDGAIADSDEVRPGVIADFDAEGNVLRFELLSASRAVANPAAVELRLEGAA
jgi:uncharacterized protein YuzE